MYRRNASSNYPDPHEIMFCHVAMQVAATVDPIEADVMAIAHYIVPQLLLHLLASCRRCVL
jgi:hypothetical protein